MVQNFVENGKFVSYYPDKHHNTRSLKRGKTKITNNTFCMEREREREREREKGGERVRGV